MQSSFFLPLLRYHQNFGKIFRQRRFCPKLETSSHMIKSVIVFLAKLAPILGQFGAYRSTIFVKGGYISVEIFNRSIFALRIFSAKNRRKINLFFETHLFFVSISLLHDHRNPGTVASILAKNWSFLYSMMWAKKCSDSQSFEKIQFFTTLCTYYYSWHFSSIISPLHIASGPVCDHFKCFEFVAEGIFLWVCFSEKEWLQTFFFSA